jgi:uncharacterized membrane protein
MGRIAGIDRFRGIAIILMVFFTLMSILSYSLPDVFKHNLAGSFHFGDTVLPMFLFAGGMSLVFFIEKRKNGKNLALDLIERFGSLVLIWAIISPLSGGGLFEMDEIMLSVLLFVPAIAMIGWPDRAIAAVLAACIIAYLILMAIGALPDLRSHYLGGFPAAPFYLPVMLAGVLAGKNIDKIERLAAPSIILTAALLLIVPPYKSAASPSFMALSATIALLVFISIKRFGESPAWNPIEYIGRRPLRYWILMWAGIITPIAFYVVMSQASLPLRMDWPEATVCVLCILAALYLLSRGIDSLAERMGIAPGRI